MSKRADRLLVIGFVAALFAMAGLFFALPLRTFSDTENRSLQGVPKLTWDNLWSKKFSQQAESYVTDQFPYRGQWVSIKSISEQVRLQQENNGIYHGQDGYLFEKFGEPDAKNLAAYTAAVKRFAERHPEAHMTFLLAPTSIGMYSDRLPWLASAYPQDKVNADIGAELAGSLTYLNGFDFLKPHSEEERPIYYRTDHHWTTYGAYLAYSAYAKQMGWTPLAESEFDIRTITKDFLGSFHTRGQFAGLTPDSIQAYVPKSGDTSTVYIADSDETKDTLYDSSFLDKKDKYSYFLGGVHALMTIKSHPDASHLKLKKLLVLKDSYAHSVLPFLAQQVEEIHVIDPRYYNGSIDSYMKQNGITDVLLLYNTATFTENGNTLASFLGSK